MKKILMIACYKNGELKKVKTNPDLVDKPRSKQKENIDSQKAARKCG